SFCAILSYSAFSEGRYSCLIANADESGVQDFADAHNNMVLAPVNVNRNYP
ncbi:MAG: hypothetical protein EZS28_027911, partial [Streblomastix strix]